MPNDLTHYPDVPRLSWAQSHGSGRWLHFFTILLDDLMPKGYFSDKNKREAIGSMYQAASYFIVPIEDGKVDWSKECWSGVISAAADTEAGSLVLEEFDRYVTSGRNGVMSFSEAVNCVKRNKFNLFAVAPYSDMATQVVNNIISYLKRLRELRIAVKKVMSFLDIDKPRTVRLHGTDKLCQLDLRKLYEEFKSHYAYETALCIPMY